jgi:ABC-type transporter Mla MlaB component
MGATVEIENGKGRIILDGDLTVQYAAELRSVLLNTVTQADEVLLEFGTVTDVDITGLQLLCSTHRTAALLSKRLSYPETLPEALAKSAQEAGYGRLTGCSWDDKKTCFWSSKTETENSR